MNELIKALNKSNIIQGKEINPKNSDATLWGPFAVPTYSTKSAEAFNDTVIIKRKQSKIKESRDLSDYNVEVINLRPDSNIIDDNLRKEEWMKRLDKVMSLIRVDTKLLTKIGSVEFIIARKGEDVICSLRTGEGTIRPIYFPREDSNVGIYCNSHNITSFVTDGKIKAVNGKLYNGSANERAIEAYRNQAISKTGRKKSFAKVLADELWQMNKEEKEENEETIVKSLNIVGYTEYLDFPKFDDDTPINQVWLEDGTPLRELNNIEKYGEYIRLSSLSQNGITAMAGPLGRKTENGYEILPVKQFGFSKGKLDISATQGVKTYKQADNQNKVLCILHEIRPNGQRHSSNMMGDVIVTREAYDLYKTKLTDEYAAEHNIKYPAHKVFIKTQGEIIRVKGAASYIEAAANINGKAVKELIFLPPREFQANGSIDTDIDKFKAIVQSEQNVFMVKVAVKGVGIFEAPAVWVTAYEDAAHSAVYSLKVKDQNPFYYGAILAMYRKNGWVKLAKTFEKMLDQDLLAHAMNCAGVKKQTLVECELDDIL